jgi:Family of unknown function (DUF5755)
MVRKSGLYISYTALFIGCAIILFIGIMYVSYQNLLNRIDQAVLQPDINVQMVAPQPTISSGDDRYTRAPKPERDFYAHPDLSVMRGSPRTLPSFATRGIPETYQQMGVLKADDGNVLPLYGRRTASRSDRYQYYSRTDSYNPVQLPIRYNNYNCVDDIGCNELYDGDVVSLVPSGQSASVTIYRISGPAYIPIV